ncbi:ABC transporter permease [Curtobacterium sp. PhB78]|uniref:ABC transporter permease n=1 Tax=Curtobacterium sp. PhB78 TaxID=2485102 RepID=UPI000F482B5C|nr:ABC transporter permease [Curtobacterium sp. PhB78]ROS45990.1 ABC-2 type transport system permease protein [Curtobacterium sp. PhB78]
MSTQSTIRTLSRVMFKADLRDFATLFFTFVFPAGLMIGLVLGLGELPSPDGGTSVDAVASNVIAFGVAFVAVFAGAQHIAAWRENGMFTVLRGAPVRPGGIIAAQAAVGGVFAVAQASLLVALAATPWLGMQLTATAPLALLGIVLGYFCFFGIGVVLANLVPSMAAVTMLSLVVVMALGIAGGAMMPLEFLPQWVQDLAPYTPVFHIREVMTQLLVGGAEWMHAGVSSLYLTGTGFVFFLIAFRTLRFG